MIGTRVGLRVGPKVGLAAGLGLDQIGGTGPMDGVTRDGTSGIYCPSSAAEWTITMAAAGLSSGSPVSTWLFQESSGDAADSVSSFTLTATGTVSYQNTEAGWSRKAVGTTDNVAGSFLSTNAALPDIFTESALLLVYGNFLAAPAAVRSFMELGVTATPAQIREAATPRMACRSGANVGTGTVSNVGAVRPYWLKVDRTGNTCVGYSDQEIVTPVFDAAMSGKKVVVGGVINVPGNSRYLYAALFRGTAAQLSDANIRTLDQTLGWIPLW